MMAKKRTDKRKRRIITRDGIRRPEDTGEAIGDIQRRLDAAVRKPTSEGAIVNLKRTSIFVAEKVFQWRVLGRNRIPSDDHVLDLARTVQRGKTLAPILVFPVPRRFYVIDGHHRLAAYDTAGWKETIPAKLFIGSLHEATRAALRLNSKNKLPMTASDRTESAWRLTKESLPGQWKDSISEVQDLCNVGKGTVDRMREVWTLLHNGQYGGQHELLELSWAQARDKVKGTEGDTSEDWFESQVSKLVDEILNAKLGARLTKAPDITAAALERLNPGLTDAVIEYWTGNADAEARPFDPHEGVGEDTDF